MGSVRWYTGNEGEIQTRVLISFLHYALLNDVIQRRSLCVSICEVREGMIVEEELERDLFELKIPPFQFLIFVRDVIL